VKSTIDRRAEPRLTRVEDHGVVATRIAPGHDARLVDVSAAGALVETATRLLPGANVEIRLSTRHRRIAIRGQVVRCCVARLEPVVYRGALRFERSIVLCDGAAVEHPLPAREEATRGVL